jgi:exosortase
MSLAVAAVLVVAASLYGPVVAAVARQWYVDPVSSHGVLLAGAATFVVWRRRRVLAAEPQAPSNWGFALLAFALLFYLAGTLAGDLFALRLSLPIAAAGIVTALLGPRQLRLLLAPLALLAMAIPLPAVVVTYLTLPLQLVASQVAAGLLNTAGVEVVRQGNLLMLRDITLEVADACSGLRSLVSLVSIAAMVGAVLSLRPQRAMMLMAAAAPIAVVGNGVRVAATGLMTTWIGEAAVRGVLHDLTGYAAFLAMIGAIILVQRATRPRSPRPRAPLAQTA